MIMVWMMFMLMMKKLITCKVECQECGLDFLRLALAVDLEKKEPLVFIVSSSSSLLTNPPLLFTIDRALVSVSARGLPSRPFPSTRDRFRENISITNLPWFSIRQGATSQPFLFGCFCTIKLKGLHISSQVDQKLGEMETSVSHGLHLPT